MVSASRAPARQVDFGARPAERLPSRAAHHRDRVGDVVPAHRRCGGLPKKGYNLTRGTQPQPNRNPAAPCTHMIHPIAPSEQARQQPKHAQAEPRRQRRPLHRRCVPKPGLCAHSNLGPGPAFAHGWPDFDDMPCPPKGVMLPLRSYLLSRSDLQSQTNKRQC